MENLRLTCASCNLSRKKSFTFSEILDFAENGGKSQKVAENFCKILPNPIQSESNPESEFLSLSESLIADEDAHEIQNNQNRVLDAAEDAGFKMSNDVRSSLIKLYAEHGLEKILDGIKSCSEHGATNLAYLRACLSGTKKKEKPKVNAQNFDQRDYTGVQDEMMSDLAKEIRAMRSAEVG